MRRGKPYWSLWATMVVALAVVAGGLFGPGCSSEEEAAAPAPVKSVEETPAAAAEAPAAAPEKAAGATEAAPAPAPAAMAPGDGPVTLSVLKYMPESANAALALPAPSTVVDHIVPVAKKLFPAEEVDREVGEFIDELAQEVNAGEAENIGAVASAKGLDFSRPLAVFLDMERTMQSVTNAAAKDDAAAADAPADDATDAEPAEDMAAEVDLNAEMPKMVVVLGVTDEAKATETLKELVAQDPDLAGAEPEQSEAEGVSINVYDPEKLAYFFAEGQIFLANDVEMLKGAAARIANPATFKYGSAEAPAYDANEAVALVYAGALGTQLGEALAALGATDPATTAMISAQLKKMEAAWSTADGVDDPLIINLSVNEERLILASRVDLDTHPKMLEMSGEPAALKYGPIMPEETLFLFDLRMTPEFKEQLKTTLSTLPSELQQDAGVMQGIAMGGQVLAMLGDELALGMAPVENDFPALLVMLGLANVEQTKGLLAMFAQPIVLETYNEVEIFSVSGVPVPVYLAYPGDTAFASNNLEVMKATIDRLKSGEATGLFGSFEPSISPATPRYSAFYLNTKLVTDVIVPLASLAGGIPPNAEPIVTGLGSVVKSIQSTQEVDNGWMTGRLQVNFQEGSAAAPAAEEAPADEAPADAPAAE